MVAARPLPGDRAAAPARGGHRGRLVGRRLRPGDGRRSRAGHGRHGGRVDARDPRAGRAPRRRERRVARAGLGRAVVGRSAPPLRRDARDGVRAGVVPRRLPSQRDRRRHLAAERASADLARGQPARDAPHARAGVRRGVRAERPGADEDVQRQRDSHVALPTAPARARPGRRVGLLRHARGRLREPRLRARRLGEQPVGGSGLARRAARPHAAHGGARQEPRVRRVVEPRQRVVHRREPRRDGGLDAPPRPQPSDPLRGRPRGRLHRRLLAHVPDRRRGRARARPRRGAGRGRVARREPGGGGGASAHPHPALLPLRVRARDGHRPRQHLGLRLGHGTPPARRRLRLGVARPRARPAAPRRAPRARLRRRLRRGRARRQLRLRRTSRRQFGALGGPGRVGERGGPRHRRAGRRRHDRGDVSPGARDRVGADRRLGGRERERARAGRGALGSAWSGSLGDPAAGPRSRAFGRRDRSSPGPARSRGRASLAARGRSALGRRDPAPRRGHRRVRTPCRLGSSGPGP